MNEIECLYKDLTLAAHRAYERNLQSGSGGNLSVRQGNGMIVKSSGGSFADCDAAGNGWIFVDFNGNPMAHVTGKPTREWRLHAALLRQNPTVQAVVHCHAPWSVAWAYGHRELPMVTWQCRLKLGCPLPVLAIEAAVVPEEELPRVTALFAQNPALPAFILRGHGLVAVGKSAVQAEHIAEMVEETAKIAVLQALLYR